MDIIARVEVPVNNSGTCCYYVECCTEAEVDAAYCKARDEGRSPRIIRLVPKTKDLIPSSDPKPIRSVNAIFNPDDEDIII